MAEWDPEDFASRIPVIGGLVGAESDASRDLQQQLRQMQQAYQQYRGQAASMRDAQLGHQLAAWNPVNDYVAQMTGTQPIDTHQMQKQFRGYGSNLGYEAPATNIFQKLAQEGAAYRADPANHLFSPAWNEQLQQRLGGGPGQAAFGQNALSDKFRGK